MNEEFEIPVYYNSKETLFAAVFRKMGFTYKIDVNVVNKVVSFEPDEEGNFRAAVDVTKLNEYKDIDAELLKAIAQSIKAILK